MGGRGSLPVDLAGDVLPDLVAGLRLQHPLEGLSALRVFLQVLAEIPRQRQSGAHVRFGPDRAIDELERLLGRVALRDEPLGQSAADEGIDAELLKSVESVNNRQKRRLFEKIEAHYGGEVSGKTIAMWGLSFKPRTDDMRDAPSRVLMEALWEAGASVRAYDPEALDETRRIYPDQDGLTLCDSADAALEGADALAILTEWEEFRSPNFDAVNAAIADSVIFDGRNLYEPATVEAHGIQYYAIGRGRS
jgi:hypothetical protein